MNKFQQTTGEVLLIVLFLLLPISGIFAQVDTGGSKRTSDHTKQVVGYITNWDAWKSTAAGYPSAGALTQLNIDYSKYTILNFSFFGVAVDGSMHSADLRNKEIYKDGVVQEPADLLYTDVYSSWDLHILFGEIDAVNYISDDVVTQAIAQGFDVVAGATTWSNPSWGIYDKPLPLPLKKEGGAKGLLDLGKDNGVKVMASIGGWSMSKHFADMASDPVKRARFIEDCKRLIDMGFDGIDLDWEFIGPFGGMNATGSLEDYPNCENLVEEIRAAIGPDKLITAAFAQTYQKLEPFNWERLSTSMDFFNFMTYDFNGGWSNIAGHNSPLYDYPGQEWAGFSVNDCLTALIQFGAPRNKINLGMGFYGRSVITEGNADLNVPTVKRNETVQPDGPIETCSDFDNFKAFDGTPNYETVRQVTGFGTVPGWTKHWDDIAKVPYVTNGKYFVSYDDEESIQYKAEYIRDNQLAGTIIWQVFGDLEFGGTVTNYGAKLKKWSDVKSPLVNKVNEVFASEVVVAPVVTITAPADGGSVLKDSNVTITATASDEDGTVSEVAFYINGSLISKDTTAPYTATFTPAEYGNVNISAIAKDNINATGSVTITIQVISDGPMAPVLDIVGPTSTFTTEINKDFAISANAEDFDGTIVSVEFKFDGVLVGTSVIAPYTAIASSFVPGIKTIEVIATDNDGLTTTKTVNITVVEIICTHLLYVSGATYNAGDIVKHNDKHWVAGWWTTAEPGTTGEWGSWQEYNDCGIQDEDQLPTISISTNDTTVDTDVAITITATASDDNSITNVEFFNGTTSLGTAISSPYTVDFSSAVAGTLQITAVVTDSSNQSVTSNALTIVVSEVVIVGEAPTVSVSADATTYNEGDVVTLTAVAQDTDGTITGVEFFNGLASLGVITSAPYTASFTGAAGDLILKAVATDNDGQSAESTILVTVIGDTPTVEAWATNVLYKVGDVVTYNGNTWMNNREHTSNSAWYPGAAGLWFWDLQ